MHVLNTINKETAWDIVYKLLKYRQHMKLKHSETRRECKLNLKVVDTVASRVYYDIFFKYCSKDDKRWFFNAIL